MTRFYRGFGLVFASDFPLAGFAETTGPADVTIRTGDAAGAAWRAACDAAGTDPAASGSAATDPEGDPARIPSDDPQRGCVLHIAQTCTYWIASRSAIHISPAPGAPQGHVMLFLAGSAIGMILHLRGIHTLHAATMARDGAAIAFAGDRGAGKSTLAAEMARPEPGGTRTGKTRVLGDDVIALESTPTAIRAHPGAAVFKLWRDTLDHFGIAGEESVMNRTEKFFTPSPQPAGEPIPLGAVVLIERGGDAIEARRLPPAAAIDAISRHGYRPEFVEFLGRREAHFRQSASVAARLPVWRLTRPEGLEHLAATRRWLETRWTDLTAPEGRIP